MITNSKPGEIIVFHDGKHVESKLYITCPKCGGIDSGVSRTLAGYTRSGLKGIGRDRYCRSCTAEYRTLEILVNEDTCI